MSAITRFLPKNHLSFIVGKLVHMKLPLFLRRFIMTQFAQKYGINLEEAEFPIEKYSSLGEFFIRRLKPGLRPIASTWAVHPADAMITQAERIHAGRLIQAKDKTYSVEQFTRDPDALKKWDQGIFLTYYLCPTDYHRVHSPVDGKILRMIHIPGALWPVNSWSTDNIHELFSINERVLVEIETERGSVGVMFVAATNVGQIILAFDSKVVGNQFQVPVSYEKSYHISIKKGDELGAFRMGSTIVMMYAKGVLPNENVQKYLGQSVRVNSALD